MKNVLVVLALMLSATPAFANSGAGWGNEGDKTRSGPNDATDHPNSGWGSGGSK